MTDGSLLTQFAANRDAEAFAQLVHRHGPMVLTAARRMAREDADDVAQAVFMLLAKKAASLANRPSVAGWLYETTRLSARNANRTRGRQLKHLRQLQETAMATAATSSNAPADPAWVGELDDALAKLSKSDRSVVLLRYVEGHTLDATASQLALTPAAVAKRAERALGRLRTFFKARGYQLTPEQAAMGLVAAVPPESLSPVVGQVLSAGGSTAKASLIAGSTAQLMTLAKVKLAGGVLAVAAVGGVAVPVVRHAMTRPLAAPASAKTQVAAPAPPPSPRAARPADDSAEDAVAIQRTLILLEKTMPEVRFDAVALSDVVSFLEDTTQLKFDADWEGLAAAGCPKTSAVSARVRNVRLGKVLSTVLSSVSNGGSDLGFAVTPKGSVRIATKADIVTHQMVERNYQVGDLMTSTGAGEVRQGFRDQISDLIVEVAGPGTWQETAEKPGGQYKWDGDTLVIRQTIDVQWKIRDLVKELRVQSRSGRPQ